MGRLYKRGATWWAYYSPGKGHYSRVSLKTADREVAKHRLRALELSGSYEPSPTDPAPHEATGKTLAKAFTEYLETVKVDATNRAYTQKARHLERLLGSATDVGAIDADAVTKYIEEREDEEAHSNTIYKELVVLRGAFKFLGLPTTTWPKYAANYVPRKTYLTRPQFDALVKQLLPDRRQWLHIACYAGLRHSELEGLRPKHIDVNLGVINVPGTKTKGARRVVPIHKELPPWLESLPVKPWENVRRDLTRAIARADPAWPKNEKGEPEPLTPNDLRRTFASWMVQAGVPLLVVARLLGHSTTRMVEAVYGQLDLATMRSAVAAF